MGNPRKHAELIKAWADGVEIEQKMIKLLKPQVGEASFSPPYWGPFDGLWQDDVEYRIKPEPPRAPQTTLSSEELFELWKSNDAKNLVESLAIVANTAIARAIEDGDVVLPKVLFDAGFIERNIVGDPGSREWILPDMVPAVMLERVASAVYEATQKGWSTGVNPDISAIIAKVKEGSDE